ncbi:alanine racemase [Sorangium sp. So ce233]|uniref:alanine racemase n=1 Tax=Sorangium sp. So ce233 TaxID=3133290 RepID=UPI003F5DC8D2
MSASHASTELSTTASDRNGTASAVEGLGSSAGPVRVLRPRRAAPADAVRPTRAEVNLAHLRHNLRVLERAMTGAQRPQIWGVLKADAYGHGAPAVARTLERTGIPGLCVALLEEAIELRDAGIRLPILVMGGYYGPRREGFEEIIARDLVPVVYDAGQIERLATVVRLEQRGRVGVHLKVDTGMGRLGAASSELEAVFAALARHPEVRLDGLMTHLACADADELGVTSEQMKRFEEIEQRAKRFGLTPRVRHASNSAAMLRLPAAWLDVVRPGVALFGISPCAGLAPDLKPVIRVRSEIVALRTIAKGDRIGYGHTWQASRESVVATVPMGYADGLSRQLSNRGAGLVRGQRAPIAGAVSMDLTMLDVTDVPGARVGDEVVFLGTQDGPLGRATISAEEIAGLTGTIAWEVLTSISRRVPRFYREP